MGYRRRNGFLLGLPPLLWWPWAMEYGVTGFKSWISPQQLYTCGSVAQVFCVSVSSPVKWGQQWHPLHRAAGKFNETMYIKHAGQDLATVSVLTFNTVLYPHGWISHNTILKQIMTKFDLEELQIHFTTLPLQQAGQTFGFLSAHLKVFSPNRL